MQRLRQAAVRPADDRPGPPVDLTRPLAAGLLLLAVTACSGDRPSAVSGTSTEASGAPCSPAPALTTPPPTGLALPAGSVVTAYGTRDGAVLLTGRAPVPVTDVLAHFRTAAEQSGYVVSRDEDEGRAGELGFFGTAGDGTVVVSRLACPRGETGFTLSVREAGGRTEQES